MSIEKEKISEFYNNYEVINFGNPEDFKSKQEIMKRQMEELVNVVLPNLVKLGEHNSEMPVGMMLATLISDNYIKKDKFISVQKNLKEMKEIADLLNLDKRLVGILGALVP